MVKHQHAIAVSGAVIGMGALAAGLTAGDCTPHWDQSIGQTGLDERIAGFAEFDAGDGVHLYAGGWFTTASGQDANRIAKWNGQQWSPLGEGANDKVGPLSVLDDGSGPALYVGGHFTQIGGIEANHIAKWDGQQWSAMGQGVNYPVTTLVTFDPGTGSSETLFAGGIFFEADGKEANHIAMWNGQEWLPVGEGTNNQVTALAVFNDGTGPAVYAGGSFTLAGGHDANRIAKWNGAEWSALGQGLNHSVLDLAVFDDGSGPALYAAGHFTEAGGEPAVRVARWDGQEWSAVGDGIGMNLGVHTLAVFDDGTGPALYAGGLFSTADGITVNSIAKWDGEQWSALESGITPFALVLAMYPFDDGSGPALYVGGQFNTVSGEESNWISRWRSCSDAPATPGDLNGDGVVDVFDLLDLLAEWGTCVDCDNCAADLDGSCEVDVFDLLDLLANWG